MISHQSKQLEVVNHLTHLGDAKLIWLLRKQNKRAKATISELEILTKLEVSMKSQSRSSPISWMSNNTWLWLWPLTKAGSHLNYAFTCGYLAQTHPAEWRRMKVSRFILLGGYLLGWGIGLFNLLGVPNFNIADIAVSWLDVVAAAFWLVLRFWWKISGFGRLHNANLAIGDIEIPNFGQMTLWTLTTYTTPMFSDSRVRSNLYGSDTTTAAPAGL